MVTPSQLDLSGQDKQDYGFLDVIGFLSGWLMQLASNTILSFTNYCFLLLLLLLLRHMEGIEAHFL